MTTANAITRLDDDEAWELLAVRTVGRIAFVDAEGRQQLLPVNYGVDERSVLLRTASGTVLGRLAQGHDAVALQTDHLQDLYQLAWSVTVTGTVREVDDPAVVQQVLESGRPAPWAPGERDVVLALTPTRIDGRRISR